MLRILEFLQDHSYAANEDGMCGIDPCRSSIMLFCNGPLAQLLVDLSETIPSIVMSAIHGNGRSVSLESFFEFFILNELVTLQSITVGKVGV